MNGWIDKLVRKRERYKVKEKEKDKGDYFRWSSSRLTFCAQDEHEDNWVQEIFWLAKVQVQCELQLCWGGEALRLGKCEVMLRLGEPVICNERPNYWSLVPLPKYRKELETTTRREESAVCRDCLLALLQWPQNNGNSNNNTGTSNANCLLQEEEGWGKRREKEKEKEKKSEREKQIGVCRKQKEIL